MPNLLKLNRHIMMYLLNLNILHPEVCGYTKDPKEWVYIHTQIYMYLIIASSCEINITVFLISKNTSHYVGQYF
jgi:hypothetical protein